MSTVESRYLEYRNRLFDCYYDKLNNMQKKAVYATEGPLLVLAGAGSGKTTVLVERIAHLIRYGKACDGDFVPAFVDEAHLDAMQSMLTLDKETLGQALTQYADSPCPPYAILSITFTNKAANEMKSRLASKLGEDLAKDVWAGTFHSICVKLLRRHAVEAGLQANFTIYDADDCKKLISQIIRDLNLDDKVFSARVVVNAVSRAKDQLLSPEDLAKRGERDYKYAKIAQIYKMYQDKLQEANAVDFDDIIVRTVRLLQNSEEVRSYYQKKFRYVCIDEYQDTNKAQFKLAALLSGGRRNIMVVGDDDQSIYRFRGATIENILNFDKTYADARVIKLEQNYRSTKTILQAANAVIGNNSGRHQKALWCDAAQGEPITLKRLDHQNDEARYIVTRVEALKKAGYRFSDFAVLYRMNAQSNALENVFAKSGIPYRMLGGVRFYERKEIKDVLAYLCVINNPSDNLRLLRIINEPKRKIGNATIQAVQDIATVEGISVFEVMQNAARYTALARSAPKLVEFCEMIRGLQQLAESAPLPELFEQTLTRTGYRDMLIAAGITEIDRVQNVNELISNAVEYANQAENPTLRGFLEEVALISDIDNYDEDADAVVMMTIHSAKGLEFPVVFLPGLEEGV
ncbi:MAG: UvrD-helicase domain-containing protein, partial [Clostridia bacterium]|nr:UvrD-helicase domain-containing protein [Clostridia bacterium]